MTDLAKLENDLAHARRRLNEVFNNGWAADVIMDMVKAHFAKQRAMSEISATVDERLDRVERELAAAMVARCEHGNPIDPTGGYVCLKCFRAAQPPGGG